MTAEKPEGDVPTLVKWLAYHASIEPRCGDAADAIMSQATRIATLEAALREIAARPTHSLARGIAVRALSAGQGER